MRRIVLAILDNARARDGHAAFADTKEVRALRSLVRDGIAVVVRQERTDGTLWTYARLA